MSEHVFTTCETCGKQCKVDYKHFRCPYCKDILPMQYCRRCHQFMPMTVFSLKYDNRTGKYDIWRECTKCRGKKESARVKEMQQESTQVAKEWLENLKDTQLLTDDAWLETCRYFRGCALCDSPDIDARIFLVPYKYGGRYVASNVIPVCTHCFSLINKLNTPFDFMMHEKYTRYKYGFNTLKEPLQKVLAYIKRRFMK